MLNAILSRWARSRWPALTRPERVTTSLGSERDTRGSGDSSLLQSLLRWIPVDSEAVSAKSAAKAAGKAQRPNMPAARAAFMAALLGAHGETVDELRQSIQRSRSARDLWHLRTWLYTEVARAHSQGEAEQRLASLAAILPPQHAGLVFSDRGTGPRAH